MPTEPVSNFYPQNLPQKAYSDEAQPELKNLYSETESRFTSSLRHVPRVAIYTLAALATQDLTHQALATPVGDLTQPDEGNLSVPSPKAEADKAARLELASSSIASPESLVAQEFVPEALRTSESVIAASDSGTQNIAVPTPESRVPQVASTNIAPPETEIMLARTSAQKERSLWEADAAVLQSASTTSFAAVQSNSMQDLKEVSTLEQSSTPILNRYAPTSQKTLNSQQTGEVAAQTAPTLSCLSYAPTSQETLNSQQTGEVVAQAVTTRYCPPTETLRQAESLQDELRDLENLKVEEGVQASPALSINIPTAFGADNNTGFISATYQQRTRFSNVDDGGVGIGIGLGDARKAVGVELSYTAASFGGSRDFGAGGFNAKIHRQLAPDLAVAAGWNGAVNVGGRNDFENSLYGVVSKVIRTREDINSAFSRVAVTAGVGNGQFRTENAVANDSDGVNVFGNIALRVAQPVSLIAEWSGQDLGVGLSVAPFKNIPLVVTPAVRDLVGAGDGPRFVLGTGLAFKF